MMAYFRTKINQSLVKCIFLEGLCCFASEVIANTGSSWQGGKLYRMPLSRISSCRDECWFALIVWLFAMTTVRLDQMPSVFANFMIAKKYNVWTKRWSEYRFNSNSGICVLRITRNGALLSAWGCGCDRATRCPEPLFHLHHFLSRNALSKESTHALAVGYNQDVVKTM